MNPVSFSLHRPAITTTHRPFESVFFELADALESHLNDSTVVSAFKLKLSAENSQFTRFNHSKVRQSGQVQDGQLSITLMRSGDRTEDGLPRTAKTYLPFTNDFEGDWELIKAAIAPLQSDLIQLPGDPYLSLPEPTTTGNRSEHLSGSLLPTEHIAETLLAPVQALDFSGFYAAGQSYRGYADSAGNRHWFQTPSFTLDYSLFGEAANQAVKGTLAGNQWDPAQYENSIATTQRQLTQMMRPIKAIPRGSYRTYLAPAAVADIIDTMVWGGGLGESYLRQGNSAFSPLASGQIQLSSKFSLTEDFRQTAIPRFNSSGELAPEHLPIIAGGQWANALVSRRSTKEYGTPSNGASASETMRSPVVAPGTLSADNILSALGTGLYLSNLHYLNWSDLHAGRMTGMTRYACFWVEDGEIIAPIENLRFDDDLYRFLGDGLIDLTDQQTFIPAVGTYEERSLGGMWLPGMLIDQFRYTL